jgi:hypothetical protein
MIKSSVRRNVIIFCTTVIIILLTFILLNSQNSKLTENEHLKRVMESTITSNNLIKIKDLTDFYWDKLYIITPYSNLKEFANINKIKDIKRINTQVEVTEGINLLIFTYNKKIVSYLNYPTNHGDFEVGKANTKYDFFPGEAIFKIERKNGQIKLWYIKS